MVVSMISSCRCMFCKCMHVFVLEYLIFGMNREAKQCFDLQPRVDSQQPITVQGGHY